MNDERRNFDLYRECNIMNNDVIYMCVGVFFVVCIIIYLFLKINFGYFFLNLVFVNILCKCGN